MAVIPAEWLVLDVLATDFLLVEFHLCSPSSKDTPATHSPAVCNHSCGLLQVEDLTASHEAVLLEMENNHTVAIAILQDDHHHKVQGSYRTRRMRQFRPNLCCCPSSLAPLPVFLPLCPIVSFVLLPMERRVKNPGFSIVLEHSITHGTKCHDLKIMKFIMGI